MLKKILLEANGSVLVDVLISDDLSKPLDIILNCPHGFLGDENMFSAFPEIVEALEGVPPKTLWDYLRIDYDFGTDTLAQALLRLLSKKKRVALITTHYNRGILDGNRRSKRAVRRIFPHEKYPKLVQHMQSLSHDTGVSIFDFCKKHLSEEGLFLDVHSMWPTCQYIHPSDF